MAKDDQGPATRSDLPVVEDWVLVTEAATMADVSRQFIHQQLDKLEPHQLSGYVALPRKRVEQWIAERKAKENQKRAEASARQAAPAKTRKKAAAVKA